MMTLLINWFVLLPLLGSLVSLFINSKRERIISTISYITTGLHLVSSAVFVVYWLLHDKHTLTVKDFVVFHTGDFNFFIGFIFDRITAVYLLAGSLLTFIVTVYSTYYMHKEPGHKRFFVKILFFFFGYNMIIFSGNLETLLIGWEVLGISSFMLIAFYRHRYLPVKNALKVFTVYRIGDVGLILAMWLSHHLWHQNITFEVLNNDAVVIKNLQEHSTVGIVISLMILLSALVKSAQLPFSTWLPRAMEGPTPSTAIFYGSLSVHLGVFLLLRTFSFWEHQTSVRFIIALIGIATAIVATGISHVQSTAKSQIAYSSIAQIGLIFIEISLGFTTLALIHFVGNAFLRTYQILVSPSVVSFLIREQFYGAKTGTDILFRGIPGRFATSLYVLSLKEWNLDFNMYRYIWMPMKIVGRQMKFLNVKTLFYFLVPLFFAGIILQQTAVYKAIPSNILPVLFAAIGLLIAVRSLAERTNVIFSWVLVIMCHFWVILAITYNETFNINQVYLYLSGILVAGVAGYLCLTYLKKREGDVNLNNFHGYAHHYHELGLGFLIACLCVAGFPITPTFIGEDLIFSHIREDQVILAFLAAMNFIVVGISLIRIYARIFLGPYSKAKQDVALRSA